MALMSPESAPIKNETGSSRRFMSTSDVRALSRVRSGYPLYFAIRIYVPSATTGLNEVLAKAATDVS
jgi:hypothetical protein